MLAFDAMHTSGSSPHSGSNRVAAQVTDCHEPDSRTQLQPARAQREPTRIFFFRLATGSTPSLSAA